LGRVLLEAAAAERAIVATDVGGTREIFPSDHGAAVIVPPGNAPALAREINYLLDQPAVRSAMGRAARARVVQAFDVTAAATRLIETYSALMK
jgi:glycosyltransferase involved in cell wall biosynthesis